MRIAVLPVYNELATLPELLSGLQSHVDRMVIINDGSTDGTADFLDGWAPSAPCAATVLSFERNRGMSAALKAGFAHVLSLLERGQASTHDLVLNIDADGQHRLGDIDRLCRHLHEGAFDMALGRRDFRLYPSFKRFGNALMSAAGSLWAGRRLSDIECGMRVIRAGSLPGLLRFFTGRRYSCAQELAVIACRTGLRVSNDCLIDVPVYRSNTRLRDAAINLSFGAFAALRCLLGWGRDWRAALAGAAIRELPQAAAAGCMTRIS